jgi:23S rRNA (adenine-N6)-dimethyltransferase
VPAGDRTPRDERRRRLGQNFLRPEAAEHFVSRAGVRPGELVVDIGAGSGVLSTALADRGADVVAVELDPVWASRLRSLAHHQFPGHINVLQVDFLSWRPPRRPFRVVACLPFGATTAILHRLLDDPKTPLERADLVVQWEVARKRTLTPPTTLVSTGWAPWWEFHLGPRIPAGDFRPVPRVDGGTLVITRRAPQLLPTSMATAYSAFVRHHWPFS